MARISGITIEIGGDTTDLQRSLKKVDGQLKTTQSNLKDINKLLKLDPGNVELLTQKQKNLESAIDLTKKRLDELKAVNKESVTPEQWDAIQREIVETESNLESLKKQYKEFGSVASQQIKAVGQSLKDAGSNVENFGKKLSGVSGAAAAIGGALVKLGYDAVQSADNLNTLSKQTGLSTDELQRMQYASELVDVSLSDITGALKKLKGKIDPSNASLQRLGVNVENADGSLRDATDVFYDVLQALSEIENETERDQVAMDLFGKSADSLAGIIDDGGAALRAYGDEAENLGLILDQDTLNALNDTNDTIDKLKANLAGTAAKIGADVGTILAPLLEKAATLIGTITEKLRKLTPEQQDTILKVVGIVAAIAPLLIVGGKLISGIGSIVSVIGTVVGVLGGPLTIAIVAVIAIGVLLYKNWDTIKAKAIELKDKVSAAWQSMKDKIASAIDNIKSKIDSVKTKFEDLKTKIQNVVQNIKNAFNFDWQLPHIKLPRFRIQGGQAPYGLGGSGFLPSIQVDWYKKAYDNPVMFTSPTVLPTAAGYKGFGDGSGAEMVVGVDKLSEIVGADRIIAALQNMAVTVVLEGDAKGVFRVVRQQNNIRTRATGYNALGG